MAREKREREYEEEKKAIQKREEEARLKQERFEERQRKYDEWKREMREREERQEKEASDRRMEIRKAKGLGSIAEGGERMLELYHNNKSEFWEAVGLPDLS